MDAEVRGSLERRKQWRGDQTAGRKRSAGRGLRKWFLQLAVLLVGLRLVGRTGDCSVFAAQRSVESGSVGDGHAVAISVSAAIHSASL